MREVDALDRSVHGILLAGGSGSRYAAQTQGADKLLASLPDGRAVLAASAETLLRVLPQVLAVVPPDRPARAALLRGLGCTVLMAPATAEGMGASLAVAARHLLAQAGAASAAPDMHGTSEPALARSQPAGVLVALGDMPWVPPDIIAQVARALATHRAAAPVYQGQRGHPVGFAWTLLPALAQLQRDVGARPVLAKETVYTFAVDAPGVLRDVDVPADLRG
ncbi:nucleotidyltransferase family protein [Achromobacter sp. GG226]|uniref:nucleotidyltransferase family protein n=1 Tax=Verticiella alkaliphila TaxID=2779529 RepID=UPI001C0B83CC|nr:nucleotidyltransferase family protein [Verticiella sp. GG226]MBU4611898.1 nucleotidyltransferase family protein [Verticiella sp. GG226]